MFYSEEQLKDQSLQNSIPISKFLKFIYYYEKPIGYLANGHFCVSNSMKEWLLQKEFIWSSSSVQVLYNQPPNFFHKIDVNTMHTIRLQVFSNRVEGR